VLETTVYNKESLLFIQIIVYFLSATDFFD
jgi:hypothetical protein